MRFLGRRVRRAIAVGLLAGGSSIAFAAPSDHRAAAAPSGGPVVSAAAAAATTLNLFGGGSDDPFKEVLNWQTELYGSAGTINLSYNTIGDFGGRENLINGLSDFVISAQPFSPSELSRLPSAMGGLIAAPAMPDAVGYLVAWGPSFTLHRSCAPRETACTPTSTYTGPLDVPSQMITDMLWDSSLSPPDRAAHCECFEDPTIIAATEASLSQGNDMAPPTLTPNTIESIQPLPLLRSDANEINYLIQRSAQQAAPGELARFPYFSPPITEFIQGESGTGIQTQEGVVSQLNAAMNTSALGSAQHFNVEGILMPVPASAATGLTYFNPPGQNPPNDVPSYPPRWVGVQNADGAFVPPSPAAIDAAVDAGGATPLYALSHSVPGPTPAYPLTYVDNFYVPAHGLSVDKAEAIATMIRYVATAGQDAMAAQGDGRLSGPLVAQALAAANQVIASNCTQTGEQVVLSSDMGRFAPQVGPLGGKTTQQRQAELASIGPMLHCVTASTTTNTPGPPPSHPSTTTTTLAPASTTSVSTIPTAAETGVLGSVATTTSSGGTAAPGSTGSASARAGGGSQPAVKGGPAVPKASTASQITGPVNLVSLPLALPGTANTTINHLVGFLLGGGAFLLLWRSRRGLLKVMGL